MRKSPLFLSLAAIATLAVLVMAHVAAAQAPQTVVITEQLPPGDSAHTASGYSWLRHQSDPNRLYLYYHGKQIGGYDVANDYYRPALNAATGIWGEPCEPPVSLPTEFAVKHQECLRRQPIMNFGVDMSRLGAGRVNEDRITLTTPNGSQAITPDTAKKILQEGLPDDRNKLRLTVIGTDQERAPVLRDLAADKDLASKVNVWSVPPEHWSLRENATGKPMFVTSGHPTVYLTKPDGTVLYREDSYKPGDIGAIRKAANYDPKKDPGRGGALLPILPLSLPRLPISLLLGGALGVGLMTLYHAYHLRRAKQPG